jgi:hypothetical protein
MRSVRLAPLLASSSEGSQFLRCKYSFPTRHGAWSLLICICRTQQGSPLLLSGVRLMLPQPEFDYLEASARSASLFVVELLGMYVIILHHAKGWSLSLPL